MIQIPAELVKECLEVSIKQYQIRLCYEGGETIIYSDGVQCRNVQVSFSDFDLLKSLGEALRDIGD